MATSSRMTRLKLPSSYTLAASRSESLLAALGRNVVLANIHTCRRVWSQHPLAHPSHVTFSHCESQLAVKSTSGEIVILATADGSVTERHVPHEPDEGANILFSASDTHLVDASWAGLIRVRTTAGLVLEREYLFPGEMISSVSSDLGRSTWLFLHKTKFADGVEAKPAYVSIWQWPLSEPHKTFVSDFSIAYSAAISPCAKYFSVVGHNQSTGRTEIHLKDIRGRAIAVQAISRGGTGSVVHWSNDSNYLATVTAEGFVVFQAPTLQAICTVPAQYPSDIAVIGQGDSLVLGTWERGWLQPMGSNA